MAEFKVEYFSIPSWTVELMSEKLNPYETQMVLSLVYCYLITNRRTETKNKMVDYIADKWIESIDYINNYKNNKNKN